MKRKYLYLILAISVITITFFLSPYFSPKKIELANVSGYMDKDKALTVIQKKQHENFILTRLSLKATLLNQFPQIATVSVSFGPSQTLIVKITAKPLWLKFIAQNKVYWCSKDGSLLDVDPESTEPLTNLTIYYPNNKPITYSSNKIPKETLERFRVIKEVLTKNFPKETFKLSSNMYRRPAIFIDEFLTEHPSIEKSLSSTAAPIQWILNWENIQIYLGKLSDIESKINALTIFINYAKKHNLLSSIESIDLRIKNKLFVKYFYEK